MKRKIGIIVQNIMILFIITSSVAIMQPVKVEAYEPYFTLIAKTNGGGVHPDYLNFLKQHIQRIGINLQVIVQNWPTFIDELLVYRNFDICLINNPGGYSMGPFGDPDLLDIFGYDETMDWDPTLVLDGRTGWGKNEWYMKKGALIMPPDSQERIQHYWAWEQYLMDKILPYQPLFTPKTYVALWGNLDGYNYTKGILQSWGKMSFNGAHLGQKNTTEVVITDAAWSDLNPLFQDDSSSAYISNAVLDPLIQYDADLSAWPMLAKSYVMENDTTILITARDGIEWAEDPDDVSDNEPFTIKDVYFTFYAWETVSNDNHLFDWIEGMEFVGDDSLRIFIDGDISTPANDPYAPFLPLLWTNILPEFYLNQTQLPDGITPDVTHSSWETFASNAFGTGPFEIDAFTKGVETTLKFRDDSWYLDDAVTSDPNLNWDERFGYLAGFTPIPYHRIRIIPNIQTALLEFEAGKVDIVDVTTYPSKRDQYATDLTKEIQSDYSFSFNLFGYNLRENRTIIGNREPCLGNPTISKGLAVRKAISYAMNREEMNDIIHRGECAIANWPIFPKMGIWCNPNIIRYDYNLQKAKEYMALAGYGTIAPTITIPSFQLAISFIIISGVGAIFVILKGWKKRRDKN